VGFLFRFIFIDMPNVIKSATTVSDGSLQRNNFVIGVDTSLSYGPTSATNFWNGIVPPSNGYTVYAQKSVNGPSIRTAQNDSELITIAKQYGGTNITTIYDALNYFNGQPNYLVTNIDYPNVNTTGTILYLDAGYTPSYPKTGTTWNDLGGKSNNATLTNSPTYSSTAGGCITFNGSNTSAPVTSSLLNVTYTGKTITVVGRSNAAGWTSGVATYRCMFGSTGSRNWNYYVYKDTSNNYFLHFSSGGFGIISSSSNLLSSGNWFVATMVNDSSGNVYFYVNGTLVSAHTGMPLSQYSASDEAVARADNFWYGDIAIVQINAVALTSAQVIANQNSLKTRFGL
jgi:hypothetical protein